MKLFLKFSYICFIGLNVFINFNTKAPRIYAEDLIEINLNRELKEGNFLIGLKQYLGKKNNKENFLIFKTENNILNVQSSNGLQHQSKEIKIIFKSISLDKPIIIERLISKPYASYESALKASKILEAKGLKPIIAMPNNWELWLPIEAKAKVSQNFKIKRVLIKNKIIPYLTNAYTYQKLDGPISINSYEDIKINNINYGKYFYLVKDSYGTWTLVQKISFDQYLNGVLPHEIGANSPIEALKAQAIIARTWAIYNSNRFKADNFHLCVTTQCQVYKPSIATKKIKQAIIDTRYKVLVYERKPINAFYHASNGGISAVASESWKMRNYPYLVSKLDLIKFPDADFSYINRNRREVLSLLKSDKNKFFGKNHYLFRWQKKVSNKEINDLLRKNNLLSKNSEILKIKVDERGISGRVIKLTIIHSNSKNPIVLVKDDIRRYLNFLPSNLFIIDNLNDNFFVFTGGGFGHGVGLSQSGAIEMAKKGYQYQKILKHYYKKTKILDFNNLSK